MVKIGAMQDPYSILGVSRDVSQAELKQSYRRLAKALHPDRQPGDSAAAERFKDVSAAYHVLGDSKQRSRFDRGEIDAYGNRRAPFKRPGSKPKPAKQRASARNPGQAKPAGGQKAGAKSSSAAGNTHTASSDATSSPTTERGPAQGPTKDWIRDVDRGATEANDAKAGFDNFGFGGFSASDLFQPFFKNKRTTDKAEAADAAEAGSDTRYRLEIGLLDAIKGGKQRLSLKDGRDIFVNVPLGVEDGQIIRLKGQGGQSVAGKSASSKPGDALVEISITPHPYFRRSGNDIYMELPVTIGEAVEGGRIAVPTIDGPVSLTVPKGSNAGTRLRLRGKGILDAKAGTRGDQHLSLRIVLPSASDSFERLIRQWSKDNDYDVRAAFRN